MKSYLPFLFQFHLKLQPQNKSTHEHFHWLPESIHPIHYRLYFHPNLDYNQNNSYSFTGRVSITIHCIKNTKFLVLNARKLNISKIEILKFKGLNLGNTDLFLNSSKSTNNVQSAGNIGINKIGSVEIKAISENSEDSEYVIELKHAFESGSEYILRMVFYGNYSHDFNGVYRRFYKDSFGQNRCEI